MDLFHPRRAFLRGLAASVAAVAGAPAFADTWPTRPLHLIVPFPPGGSTDLLGRAIGQELSQALKQPVVIENVPGAGGSIGAERAARSTADGYTLLMGHIGTLAVNPSLYPKLGYDPVRSFTPVAWVARVPNVLAVNPAVPASNVKELVAYAKSHPGQLSYGSGGNGSAAHMAMEYFKMSTQSSLLHIPYRGTAPAVVDVIAGQVQATFTGVPALLPHIKAGKLRALAVSSPRRLAVLPDVPTVAESGVPGTKDFEADQWYGLVAPAGTPPDIVAQLNRLVNASLASNAVRERLASEGAEATPTTPQAFAQLIAREIPRWKRVIETAHVKPE